MAAMPLNASSSSILLFVFALYTMGFKKTKTAFYENAVLGVELFNC